MDSKSPWGPCPGAGGGYESKSKVRLPTGQGVLTKIIKGRRDFVPRRLRIKKEDLEKFGFTTGCPGCRAATRISTAVAHSEQCRKRILEELEKVGDERIEKEQERFFEYLEEEENEKKKAKMEEATEGSNQAAASSSGGGGV